MSTMAEVLVAHQWYDATNDDEDPATGCTGCPDWFGSEDALDDGTFAAHQADVLSVAGYGKLADAWDAGHGIGWVDCALTLANGERHILPNPYGSES